MSRTYKIYNRLDLLESEFLSLLADEFRLRAKGVDATYLKWYEGECHGLYFFSGKKYLTTHIQRMEKLRAEIVALRETLGESTSEGATAMLEEYVRKFRAQSEDWRNKGESLAKRFLDKLGPQASASERPSS